MPFKKITKITVQTESGDAPETVPVRRRGTSAETIASITIALSTFFKAPMSTTHVLSSAVAGTMIAKNGTENLHALP
jgi:phenylpyruvate tautomerase PptA (4-oxalocrotonate tautomerase family)